MDVARPAKKVRGISPGQCRESLDEKLPFTGARALEACRNQHEQVN